MTSFCKDCIWVERFRSGKVRSYSCCLHAENVEVVDLVDGRATHRFAWLARRPHFPCGPDAKLFELYIPPSSAVKRIAHMIWDWMPQS